MNEEQFHAMYRMRVYDMLFDFFRDSGDHFEGMPDEQIRMDELNDFIYGWIEKHFTKPMKEWNP